MALNDLLYAANRTGIAKQSDKLIFEQRIDNVFDHARNLIAFFRQYPDIFIDFIKGEDCTFRFLTYQRVFLRVIMRHRYTYATFPRAYSKSFLTMMAQMISCILYPNSHLFTTTGGKEQAASITMSKVQEICKLIPALKREIDWTRGVTKKTKDSVVYVFKNGSVMDILAARQSSRGQRRTAGVMEECILIDKDILNEVIIPTTNVDRYLPDGSRAPEEVINKRQTYIKLKIVSLLSNEQL